MDSVLQSRWLLAWKAIRNESVSWKVRFTVLVLFLLGFTAVTWIVDFALGATYPAVWRWFASSEALSFSVSFSSIRCRSAAELWPIGLYFWTSTCYWCRSYCGWLHCFFPTAWLCAWFLLSRLLFPRLSTTQRENSYVFLLFTFHSASSWFDSFVGWTGCSRRKTLDRWLFFLHGSQHRCAHYGFFVCLGCMGGWRWSIFIGNYWWDLSLLPLRHILLFLFDRFFF